MVVRAWELGFMFGRICGSGFTRTPKVCKIMAFMAILGGLGLLFYILLGLNPKP